MASLSSHAVQSGVEGLPFAIAEMLHQIDVQGVSRHGYLAKLAQCTTPARRAQLVDAIHLLALLHNGSPIFAQLTEITVRRLRCTGTSVEAIHHWHVRASMALEEDRRWLVRLMLHFGPSPRMQQFTHAAQQVRQMRSNIVTLLQSERVACALGSMLSLAQQGEKIRAALSTALAPMGLAHPASADLQARIVPRRLAHDLVAAHMGDAVATRAMGFGMVQVAQLHAALLNLLEARQAHSLP